MSVFQNEQYEYLLNFLSRISCYFSEKTRGPFLESPDNLTGPKSDFDIKVSREVGCFLASNEVHFVSLANNFTV